MESADGGARQSSPVGATKAPATWVWWSAISGQSLDAAALFPALARWDEISGW